MQDLKFSQVIGHRGAKGYAPENTLAAIHTASDMGVEWVSIDVSLSKDSVPLLYAYHDLEIATNGNGLLHQTKWSVIQDLDAGQQFNEGFYGEPIPSLEDALSTIIDRGLKVILSLNPYEGREEETAEVALDELSRIWDEPKSILICSSKPECLDVARHYLEDYPRGFLLEEHERDWESLAKELELSALLLPNTLELANEFFIKGFKRQNYKVITQVVNEYERAETLLKWGVDAIISDFPDLLD